MVKIKKDKFKDKEKQTRSLPRLGALLGACLAVMCVLYAKGRVPSRASVEVQLPFEHNDPIIGYVRVERQVERLLWEPDKPFARRCFERGDPVILTNTVATKWRAMAQWTPSFLRQHIRSLKCYVNKSNRFFGPYFDPRRPLASHATRVNPYGEDISMKTDVFFTRMFSDPHHPPYAYFSGEIDKLSPTLEQDIDVREMISLRPSVSSINVWMGPSGAVTPCHYDGYANFYVQLTGRKRFLLFPPSASAHLRVYPFLHPNHAQCQLNLTNPQSQRVACVEAVLERGDVLYIPPLWFHQVITEGPAISVNAWTEPPEAETMAQDVMGTPPPALLTDSPLPVERAELAIVLLRSLSLRLGMTRDFVYQIATERYSAIVKDGLLMVPTKPQWPGHVDVCDDPERFARLSRQFEHDKSAQTFLSTIQSAFERIPSCSRHLWLGNYVEYMTAVTLVTSTGDGIDHVARVLLRVNQCI